jgi:pimeloyl-ACP methyl ester carboxylesterase
VTTTSLRLRGDGVELIADAFGDATDPPVILAHGGGQTRHAWAGTGRRLAGRGWYALAVDQRGHGESGWADDGDYRLERFGADLRHVVGSLSQPPVLIGASLGGLASISAIAGAVRPIEVARALVLVDIAPTMRPAGSERIRSFMLARPDGFDSLDEVADAVAAYNFHRERPADVAGLRRNLRRNDAGRLVWHWDPRFLTVDDVERRRVQHDTIIATMDRVVVPTLLVRGGASDVIGDEDVARFRELVPHGEVVVVPGAGHMVAGDRNDAFSTAVEDFLDRVPTQPGA